MLISRYYSTTKDANKATPKLDKIAVILTMTTDQLLYLCGSIHFDVSDISPGLAKVDNGTKGDHKH